MFEQEASQLLGIIKAVSKGNRSNDLIIGTVKKLTPIEIDIGNGILLNENQIFLGQMCRPHQVTIPHSHLVNALMTEKTKGIITTGISAGVSTDVQQTTGKYDIKTQEITKNEDKGTNERELKTESKTSVDLGGAKLAMSINVAGSSVTGTAAAPVGNTIAGAIASTTDLSTFTPTDNGHQHIIPEHSTQDVHFPDTDYEDSVEMEIYPRLKVGDHVLMFAFNDFQMYYVAERIEED